MPSGGSIPGDTDLKARPRSSTASRVTTQYTTAARRYVAAKTMTAIHSTGRVSNQSLIFTGFA
jgi:hypothetical protein